jgi:LmbE family N-acetylglucosaminyl deacetylase
MKNILTSLLLGFSFLADGQINQQPNAAEIQLELSKLNFLGSVLYVAAHPDDENTRIITSMANGRLAETAYLSMTRGDGGQNLIGPEMRDLLGLIRTQELLAARRIDGGIQFFTRANDFGYSRSVDETMKIWNKEEILSDVVRVYRKFKPDVIITRFPADERAGHGHHTASAVLAQEAFDISPKANQFPDQVKDFGTWQAKRIYINTGRWWNNTIDESTPGITSLNVGGFSPLLGESYTEIASRSRSQHKSQGFGSRGARGDELEFLELIKGEQASKDIFDGINTSWTRLKGGEKIQPLVEKAIAGFDPVNPAGSINQLFEIRTAIQKLDNSVWKERKLADVEKLIRNCLGLYIHVHANNYWISPEAEILCDIEIVNRSTATVVVGKITSHGMKLDSTVNVTLRNNIPLALKVSGKVSSTKNYSDPYWLSNPHGLGIFTVLDKNYIGKPENDPALLTTFSLNIQGKDFNVTVPVDYSWTDRVEGEQVRPVEITPPVFVNLSESVIIFNDNSPKVVQVTVKSAA